MKRRRRHDTTVNDTETLLGIENIASCPRLYHTLPANELCNHNLELKRHVVNKLSPWTAKGQRRIEPAESSWSTPPPPPWATRPPPAVPQPLSAHATLCPQLFPVQYTFSNWRDNHLFGFVNYMKTCAVFLLQTYTSYLWILIKF
jgi:hypothetical protein